MLGTGSTLIEDGERLLYTNFKEVYECRVTKPYYRCERLRSWNSYPGKFKVLEDTY